MNASKMTECNKAAERKQTKKESKPLNSTIKENITSQIQIKKLLLQHLAS